MVVALPVGAKRLKFSNIDRAVISGDSTGAFAQDFLWAETSAYFGEIGREAEDTGRLIIPSLFNGEQGFGDVIVKGAAYDARLGSRAVNAARCFKLGLLLVIAQEDRLEIPDPFNGRLLRRRSWWNMNAFGTTGLKVVCFRIVRFVQWE